MNGIFIIVSFIIRLVMSALGVLVFVRLYMPAYAAHFTFGDALGWALGLELLRIPNAVHRLVRDVSVNSGLRKPDVAVSIICTNCITAVLAYPTVILAMMFVHWLTR